MFAVGACDLLLWVTRYVTNCVSESWHLLSWFSVYMEFLFPTHVK